MKKILITRKLIKSSEEYAAETFETITNKEDKLLTKDDLIKKSSECDGILASLTEKIDYDVISKLSDRVKIISNFAVGFGNIDIEAATKRNITVTNTPEVLTDATAEIAMLILLGAARNWGKELDLDVDSIIKDMESSDYEHLIKVFDKHFGMIVDLVDERLK